MDLLKAIQGMYGNAVNTVENPGEALQQAYRNYQNGGVVSPLPQNQTLINNPAQTAYQRLKSNLEGGAISAANPIQQAVSQLAGKKQQVLAAQTQPSPTYRPEQSIAPPDATDTEVQEAKIYQKYGIAPATGFTVKQGEGGRIGANNPFNIGAVDSNPNNAANYTTAQAGIEAGAKTMRKLLDKLGVTSQDPRVQLQALQQAGYAGDPTTWKKRSIATGGAGKYYNSWSDYMMALPTFDRWTGTTRPASP